jgi:hypothetical protein
MTIGKFWSLATQRVDLDLVLQDVESPQGKHSYRGPRLPAYIVFHSKNAIGLYNSFKGSRNSRVCVCRFSAAMFIALLSASLKHYKGV